jgi:hypothetical protein
MEVGDTALILLPKVKALWFTLKQSSTSLAETREGERERE